MSFVARRKAEKHLPPEGLQLVDQKFLQAQHTMAEWRALIDAITQYEREAKESLSARFDLLIVPFLRVIDQDVPPGRTVALRIDLRSPHSPDKGYATRQLDTTGTPYRKFTENWYADYWFSGEAALAGQSTLQWAINDRVRERVIEKRSVSGRMKTKQKYKTIRRIEVHLSLAGDRWVAAEPDSEVPWMTMKTKRKEKRHDLKGRTQYTLGAEDAATELHRLMLVVSQVYRYAAPRVAS